MKEEQKEQLRQKLKSWLDEIGNELGWLLSGRDLFARLRKIVESNEKIQSPPILYNWIADNYVAKMCTSIRALTERGTDAFSLRGLIEKIQANPDVVTRDYFISQSKDDFAKEMGTAGQDFDRFAKTGEQHIDPERLESDVRKLKEGTRLIKDFTDQWVAHFDQKRKIERMPRFEDLDRTLDIIDEVWCDYSWLLRCHPPAAGTRKPTMGPDWEAPLRHRWIEDPEQEKNEG